MIEGCINNTIQKYMEEIITKLDLKHTDKLYDLYKEVRVEIASRGMITMKDTSFCMSNPKSIAVSLVYIWAIVNGITIRQRDIAESVNITETTIQHNYTHLKKWFMLKGISMKEDEE